MTQEVGDMKKFAEIEGNLKVLARCQPTHKLCLVLGLQKLNRVVAATGDGTNDAPILKNADVGFAMNDGSDIAKNAAPIVLLDNNFNSTQTAVKYGRNIYDCTRKFLQFQLTVNFVALAIIFIGSCGLDAQPFTAVQMLWVNLIMDTFAALALATEPPSPHIFERMPQDRDESIINAIMWRNIIGQAIY